MAGTDWKTKICLKGKGIKHMKSHGSGDHYVHIKIDGPLKKKKRKYDFDPSYIY